MLIIRMLRHDLEPTQNKHCVLNIERVHEPTIITSLYMHYNIYKQPTEHLFNVIGFHGTHSNKNYNHVGNKTRMLTHNLQPTQARQFAQVHRKLHKYILITPPSMHRHIYKQPIEELCNTISLHAKHTNKTFTDVQTRLAC